MEEGKAGESFASDPPPVQLFTAAWASYSIQPHRAGGAPFDPEVTMGPFAVVARIEARMGMSPRPPPGCPPSKGRGLWFPVSGSSAWRELASLSRSAACRPSRIHMGVAMFLSRRSKALPPATGVLVPNTPRYSTLFAPSSHPSPRCARSDFAKAGRADSKRQGRESSVASKGCAPSDRRLQAAGTIGVERAPSLAGSCLTWREVQRR